MQTSLTEAGTACVDLILTTSTLLLSHQPNPFVSSSLIDKRAAHFSSLLSRLHRVSCIQHAAINTGQRIACKRACVMKRHRA